MLSITYVSHLLVVTTWRAHVENINSLDFIDEHKLLITASNDCSVRLWNKDGDYVGEFFVPNQYTTRVQ